jgi:RNA polymerase sigma factor (sigma-70 family)
LGNVLQQIRKLVVGRPVGDDLSDGQLLERYVLRQDEAAFAALVRRRGPMVLGLCRRLLPDPADADDAFQATFLVLIRRAGSLDRRGSLAGWLYGVASRVAQKAKVSAARRRAHETEAQTMPRAEPSDCCRHEVHLTLHEEVSLLPEKFRAPLVLCYLEGKTNEEAAQELCWPAGTVKGRLSQARELLRNRLARRGVALSAAMLATQLTESMALATVPAALADPIVKAAALGHGGGAAGLISAQAIAWAEGVARALASARLKLALVVLLAVGVAGSGAGVLTYRSLAQERSAQPPPAENGREVSLPPMADAGLAARVEDMVRQWQPTPDERRFDRIGWAPSIRAALDLAQQHGRPVFLYALGGRLELGRCGGGAAAMRAGPLSNPEVIDLLNRYYVPVYVSQQDYAAAGKAAPEEKAELQRIYAASLRGRMAAGSDYAYIVAPDGRPVDTLCGCVGGRGRRLRDFLEWTIRERELTAGATLINPVPQSAPPPAPAGALVLHLTARYLMERNGQYVPLPTRVGGEQSHGWNAYPAENWVVLDHNQCAGWLPSGIPRTGTSWEIDPAAAAPLLTYFYPQTEEDGTPRNRIDHLALKAQIVALHGGVARARINGTLRMKHPAVPNRDDDDFVDATVLGFMDVEMGKQRIKALQIITERATYRDKAFGVAVRSLP